MHCFLLNKDFLIDSFSAFLQASIVTVIHLVNAVVDTVTKEGISACVLCLSFEVSAVG